MKNSSLKRN